MSDAPEKVWVHYEPDTDDAIWSEYPDMDGLDEFNHYGEYTRSDIAQARIDKLEKVPEPVRIQRVHDLDRNGEFMGHHIINCNPDGTDATVTWEPIGGEY